MAAVFLYTAAVCIIFSGVVVDPNRNVAGGPNDLSSTAWAWAELAQHGGTPWTTATYRFVDAPEGLPTARALDVAAPIQAGFVWVTKGAFGFMGALNIFGLLGLVATGAAMFMLLEYVGCDPVASLFGGAVVALNPWIIQELVQGFAAYTQAWSFVLLIYLLLRLHARPTMKAGAAAGAGVGLTFYVASYFGLLGAVIVVAFVMAELVFGERGRRRALVRASGLVLAVPVAMLLPAAAVSFHDGGQVSATVGRGAEQAAHLGVDPLLFLLPSPWNPWLGSLTRSLTNAEYPTTRGVYFGLATSALAAVGVVLTLRRTQGTSRFAMQLAMVLVPVAIIFALPPFVHVGGIGIPTGSAVVTAFTSYYRVFARVGLLVGFGLAMLAAFGLTWLRRRYRVGGQVVVLAALALTCVEFLPGHIPVWRDHPAPEWATQLAHRPVGTVAHFPYVDSNDLFFQGRDPVYNEFGDADKYARVAAIRLLARNLTDPLTPGVLAAEQVRYVVVHDDQFHSLDEHVPRLSPAIYRLIEQDGNVQIYELHATPVNLSAELDANAISLEQTMGWAAPAFSLGQGFFSQEPTGRWMKQDATMIVDNTRAASPAYLFEALLFSAIQPRNLTLSDRGHVLATITVETFQQKVYLPIHLPPGRHQLTLHVSPDPQRLGATDPRVASIHIDSPTVVSTMDFSQ